MLAVALAALAPIAFGGASTGHFERMMFNNPGLEVDLSLGIWAFVAAYDYDKDGKTDVAVRASAVPIVGSKRNTMCRVYLNPSGRSRGIDVPVSASRMPDAARHPDASGVRCPHPGKPHTVRTSFVDFDTDGVEDVVYSLSDWSAYGKVGPSCPVAYDSAGAWTNGQIETYLYFARNAGTLREPEWETPVPVVCEGDSGTVLRGPWGGYAAMFRDFDGDGDMDFLTGEFVDSFWYFENVAGRGNRPRFAKGRRICSPDGSRVAVDLCMFNPVLADFDGDGIEDIVAADEDGRVAVYAGTGKFVGGAPAFLAGRYLRQEAQELKFGCLSTPFGCDWDGDGDWDFVCGNSAGYISFIENLSGPGVERPKWAEPRYLTVGGRRIRTMAGWSGSPQGPAERKWGYSSVSVGDWDGDGMLDVISNDINGDILLYRGTRRGGVEMETAVGVEVEWVGEQPTPPWEWRKNPGRRLRAPWRTTADMFDWNRDGLLDLVVMDCEGYLALYERFRALDGSLRLKAPRRAFVDERGDPLRFNGGSRGGGGRARFCLADWDGDGRTDILQAAFNARLVKQVSERDGKGVFRYCGRVGVEQLQGHTCCPTTVDFNADGVPDLVVAAEDGYFYYMPNPRAAKR
jgi:hypothetical protein